MKYITLWFPTIFHRDLVLKRNSIEFRVDDMSSPFPYLCTLNFHSKPEGKHNIEIISKLTKTDGTIQEFTVILVNEDISKNGFAIYSCDDSPVPEDMKDIFFGEDLLGKPIYHKIKEFYHIHESVSDKDSALIAQVKSKLEKINKPNNEFLINFLKDFEKMFRDSAETISSHNLNLQTKIEKYKDNNSHKLEELIIETQTINRLCENALIEYTYCKTLLTSIYNKSFRHDILPDNPSDEQIEDRRKALNIRNAVRYIENVRYKNSNRQDYILSEILKDGERTQRISLTLGFIGVIYALIFCYKDSIEQIKWFNFENWWLVCLLSVSISGFILLFINTKWFIKIKHFLKRFTKWCSLRLHHFINHT